MTSSLQILRHEKFRMRLNGRYPKVVSVKTFRRKVHFKISIFKQRGSLQRNKKPNTSEQIEK